MTREELDTLLDETINEVVTLSKKDRDRLIDVLVEALTSSSGPGLELDDEDEDEEEEPS